MESLKPHAKIFDWLSRLIGPELEKDGCVSRVVNRRLHSMKQAVFTLCDLTLRNYKMILPSITIAENGELYIDKYDISIANPELYENMYNDILAIIEKYHNEVTYETEA